MEKIRWSDLLLRLSELDSGTFFKSHGGKVVRRGIVSEMKRVDRDVQMISEDGEKFFFPNEDTFAFGGMSDGHVLLKRHGQWRWDKGLKMWCQLIDSFRFEPKAPFTLPSRERKERVEHDESIVA